MKINNNRKIGALVVSTLALVLNVAQADEFKWDLTGSGNWNTDTNWYNVTLSATASGTYPFTGDIVTIIGSGNIVNVPQVNPLTGNPASLTIESDATLMFNSGLREMQNTVITNAGLILFKSGGFNMNTDNVTNTGTIAVDGAQGAIIHGVNNTGGLIVLRSGYLNSGFNALIGGQLEILATGTYSQTDVQGTNKLDSVTVTNAGLLNWSSWISKGETSSRTKSLTLTDGTFANSGIVNLQQLGSSSTAAVNLSHNLNMQLSGSNVFTNSGQLLILNNTSDTQTNDQIAQFTVNSGATLENGSGAAITISNSASGTANSGYAQYARLTVSDGATFTNSGSITVSLDAATTDDAQHYATLLINRDWTNTGVITVDRANKTAAVAALDLTGQAYTQTGADAVTRLLNGGQLNAASATISAGLLGGNGVISAATTISAGATLDPDGTLTLTSLTLDAGGILNFSLADTDLLNITGNLTLGGATLNLTDDEVSTGTYSIANYGTLTDGYALTVSGLADEYTYKLDFITDSKISLTIIPEPSTWVLLLTGALTLAALRRRR
ncbi:MAG: autotransporter adhesin family protein [Verrucomicrobiales bacterium]|jgi:hypothetical protein|nr:autotransporter adhesin family protein [Verrucomicrobiales bacterium]